MRLRPFGRSDVLHQFRFHLEGRVGILGHQSQAVAHAEHMRIDGDGWFSEGNGLNDVGGLSPHARQHRKFLNGGRNIAAKTLDQQFRQTNEIFGLAVWVGNGANVGENGIRIGLCHGFRRGKVAEQAFRDHVHPLVGTLCGKYDGHKQLKRRMVAKFGVSLWRGVFQARQNRLVTLFFQHGRYELCKHTPL